MESVYLRSAVAHDATRHGRSVPQSNFEKVKAVFANTKDWLGSIVRTKYNSLLGKWIVMTAPRTPTKKSDGSYNAAEVKKWNKHFAPYNVVFDEETGTGVGVTELHHVNQ